MFTPDHFERLMKSLPQIPTTSHSQMQKYNTEDELNHNFVVGISCHSSIAFKNDWILDTCATNHMTSTFQNLINPKFLNTRPQIKLPIGQTSFVSHIGKVNLQNDLPLQNTLFMPSVEPPICT